MCAQVGILRSVSMILERHTVSPAEDTAWRLGAAASRSGAYTTEGSFRVHGWVAGVAS